jgi:hypothetical protein
MSRNNLAKIEFDCEPAYRYVCNIILDIREGKGYYRGESGNLSRRFAPRVIATPAKSGNARRQLPDRAAGTIYRRHPMKQARRFFIIVSVIMVLIGSCSHDKGVQPTPKPQEKDYVVYFADYDWGDQEQGNKYYGYHTLTGVVDSFVVPGHDCRVNGLAISPDGSFMYLYDGTSFLTVDLATKGIVAEHPVSISRQLSRQMIISPNGNFIAMQGRGFSIVSVPEFSVVFADTVQLVNGYFTPDGRFFYGSAWINSDLASYRVDLENGFVVTTWLPPYGGAYMTVPSPDYKKLFLYIWIYNELFYFCVHDVDGDSLTYYQMLLPGYGRIIPTPDWKYLVVVQIPQMNGTVPLPDSFTIFDIQNNTIYKKICTLCWDDDSTMIPMTIQAICLTPDGRHLVNAAFSKLFDFNLATMKYDRFIEFGHDASLRIGACQTQP